FNVLIDQLLRLSVRQTKFLEIGAKSISKFGVKIDAIRHLEIVLAIFRHLVCRIILLLVVAFLWLALVMLSLGGIVFRIRLVRIRLVFLPVRTTALVVTGRIAIGIFIIAFPLIREQ